MLIAFDVPLDRIKYVDSDTVCVIANLAKMKQGFRCPPDNGTESIKEAVFEDAASEEWERVADPRFLSKDYMKSPMPK